MPISDEKLSSYLDQKGYEVSALKEEAKRLDFSQISDMPAFIQQRISEVTEQIPDEIEYKPVILKYFRCALKAYNRGDDDAFRLDYLRADRNLENALSDRWTLGVIKQYGRNAERFNEAIKEKRKPAWDLWQKMADEIRSKMLAANPNREPSRREIALKVEQSLKNEGSEHAASFETIKRRIVISG